MCFKTNIQTCNTSETSGRLRRATKRSGITLSNKDLPSSRRTQTFINGASSSATHPKWSGSVAEIARPRPLNNSYACAATTSFNLLLTKKGHFSSSSSVVVSLSGGEGVLMLTLIHKECGGPALDESPVGEVCAIPTDRFPFTCFTCLEEIDDESEIRLSQEMGF